jgi:hypothetical protein
MTNSEIIRQRLINQKLTGSAFQNPQQVVNWMIALQAQEFAMAKWAIGLRLPGWNDDDIEKSFNEGSILRTHLLRPTWHFVTPMDIRWLLALTKPHINAASAYYHRKSELDSKTFNRCQDILAKTLEGGDHLSRKKLQAALARAKINADGQRLAYIMMHAELDGIICSGPRAGKQFTYSLLDKRVPATKKISRDEALSILARRFFASRGPATIQDLSYWSGLTIKEIKAGIESLPTDFEREIIEGQEYIFLPYNPDNKNKPLATFLLPDYDEYGMSYRDRDSLYYKNKIETTGKKSAPVFSHIVIVEGMYAGNWQRTMKGNKVLVDTKTFSEVSKVKQQAVKKAEKKYLAFFKH